MNLDEKDMPETQLVSSAQSGDTRSFELLFDRYYDMIHTFAYRVCLVETEADDIAQETFIRAARGLQGFRGTASFKNWLHRIAHHVLTDSFRRNVRRDARQSEIACAAELESQVRPADFARVHEALSKLSPEWREAIALVYFDDLSHAEAARVLGCAETTVSWRIFRAKRTLGKMLAGTGDA
jgi:RNA polymerase sigma-70 factor (ECF subfamily)